MGRVELAKFNFFKDFVDDFLNQDRYILILKLSLLFIVAFTTSAYYLHIPIRIMALYMIFSNRLAQNKTAWMILSIVNGAILLSQWDFIDNHKYLSCYWIFTCTASLYHEKPLEMLRLNARLFIGIIFLIATIHKITWGQYHNGSFMYFTYLTDGRFEWTVGLATRITMDVLPSNYSMLKQFNSIPGAFESMVFKTDPKIYTMALITSWWVIFIEGSVGILFLFAHKLKWFYKLKDLSLIVFILSTYSLVMVSGFNYMLVLLGFSQVKEGQKKTVYLYMASLLIFEMRQLPIKKWVTLLFFG